jgi:hypothetical protein
VCVHNGPCTYLVPHVRHYLERITLSTGKGIKVLNTIIEPGVDVATDVADINAGRAARVAGGDWLAPSGRQYGVEQSGKLFPRSGPGFTQINRGTYRALMIYGSKSETAEAEAMIALEKGITQQDRLDALALRAKLGSEP